MIRIMLAIFFCTVSTFAIAQESTKQSQPKGEKIYVAFRMENWKAKHIHDAAQAKTHMETLKQLGCEVKSGSHDGHTDVQCRTVFWKSLALDTPEQAKQWVNWLQQSGFDTIHGSKAGTEARTKADGSHREIVQYRLVNWRSKHIHDPREEGQLLALYRALGCEITKKSHDGHTDVNSRCPEWMEFALPTHDAAHKWQEFLNQAGFETKHEH